MRIVVTPSPSHPPPVREEGKLYSVLPPRASVEPRGSCAAGAENTGKKPEVAALQAQPPARCQGFAGYEA